MLLTACSGQQVTRSNWSDGQEVRASTVWSAGSLIRVGHNDPPRPERDVRIAAGRAEFESFQLVVSGGRGGLDNIDLAISDLAGPGGAIIARDHISRFREQYVTVEKGSPNAGGRQRPGGAGRYADGLIPFDDPATGRALSGPIAARGASVGPGENQPYWVDVFIPAETPAGEYTGTYRVSTDQGRFDGEVRLIVADFTLDPVATLRTSFLSSTDRAAVDQELLRNRLMPATAPGDAATPPTQGPVSIGVSWANAANAGFYSGADRDTCRMSAPPSVAEIARVRSLAPPGALVYNYTADEITDCDGLTGKLQEWARALHQADVLQLVTMPPDPALFTDGTGGAGVDIWVMLPKDFDAERIDAVRRAGGMQVWSYTALSQDPYSPKWLADYSPANFRMLPGFLNQSMGIEGTLYWRVDDWADDPWNVMGMYDGAYPGDGMLVYPGEQVGLPDGAAPSLRLKWIRDGVEDYTYAAMARAAGNDTQVTDVVHTVARDWENWSQDPQAIETARLRLIGLLSDAG